MSLPLRDRLKKHTFVYEAITISTNCVLYKTGNGPVFLVFGTPKTVRKYLKSKRDGDITLLHCSHDLRGEDFGLESGEKSYQVNRLYGLLISTFPGRDIDILFRAIIQKVNLIEDRARERTIKTMEELNIDMDKAEIARLYSVMG